MDEDRSDLYEARSLLADMVSQHCTDRQGPHKITTFCISANEDAITYLEKIGWLELVPIKALRWRWTPAAFKEET